MLVEDNDLVRESLEQTLSKWGLQVHTFAEATPALRALALRRYDAVLSDGRLPGVMNGLGLLAQCASVQPASCMRILMTGEPVDGLGTLPAGITSLQKPVRRPRTER